PYCASRKIARLQALSRRLLPIGLTPAWQLRNRVTPKHPPHFVGKLARDRNDCFGRFLFVRDARRVRSGAGPVQAHRDRQEEGGAWELQKALGVGVST